MADAIVARACIQQDSTHAVQAKREIGRLWEDIDKPPYKILFNSGVTGPAIWKLVQTLRTIEDELKDIGRNEEGSNKLLAVHGNRFITHLVFGRLQQKLDDQEVRVSDEFKGQAKKQTRQTYKELAEIVDDSYPDSYLASLFKNGTKCQDIKEKYLDGAELA